MEILQVTVLGGLLALDGTSVGQFMLSRPLVAGALAGWVLGEPGTGLIVGAILELYLLVSFPTGGSRFPEGATATVVGVASAVGAVGPGSLPIAVAFGLLWGQLGGFSITYLRDLNARLVPEPGTLSGRRIGPTASHLLAILLDFLRGAAMTLLGVVAGRSAVRALAGAWDLGPSASTGLLLLGGAVSAGILLHDLGGFRKRRVLFVAGMVLGIVGARIL
jgi:PTS system mannose-specific IIC component